ncbi:MAG: putative sulfate/molybdate transporter [Pseudomonadota bacterium]
MRAGAGNRYDRQERAGAFGDLCTLIPLIVAYVGVLKIGPSGSLLAFGVSMLVCGLYYKTPFPVQPMKAMGAVASIQARSLRGRGAARIAPDSVDAGQFCHCHHAREQPPLSRAARDRGAGCSVDRRHARQPQPTGHCSGMRRAIHVERRARLCCGAAAAPPAKRGALHL